MALERHEHTAPSTPDDGESEVKEAFIHYGMTEKGLTRAQVEAAIANSLAELDNPDDPEAARRECRIRRND